MSPGASSESSAIEPSATGEPSKSLFFIMIIEVPDFRFHKVTGNARYYPEKTAI